MKRLIFVLTFALPVVAMAQITNTRHDMSQASTSAGPKAAAPATPANNQICIYCHTPHKAAAQALLWNRATPATTYGWAAGSKTLAGTPLPTNISADSKRCVLCHDGTTALGNLNNVGGGVAGTITMTNATVTAGYTVTSGVPQTDLVNNHPVSIAYAGQTNYLGNTSLVPAGQVGAAVLGGYYNVLAAGCASPSGFCTSKAVDGLRINIKQDGASLAYGIECSTCHEPHNQYGLSFLLRVDSARSALCLACHNK